MEKTIAIQTQIRHNAEEISSALGGMSKWEKDIGGRDKNIKKAHESALRVPRAPIRSGVGTVPVQGVVQGRVVTVQEGESSLWQTPSSIVQKPNPNTPASKTTISNMGTVPKALGTYTKTDAEEVEREKGNAEFKGGNFTAAVKCYTRCLGLRGRNHVAFSNRAMAYLKLKEHARAVSDCTSALSIDPQHVKSLLRRSSGLNSLGRHRAALRDLILAGELEPGSKQVRSDTQHTRELLRNAANRAPLVGVGRLQIIPKSAYTDDTIDEGVRSEGGMQSEGEGMMGVQGPDVKPPNFGTAGAGTGEGAGKRVQRVPIEIEEEEEEEEEIQINKPPSIPTPTSVPTSAPTPTPTPAPAPTPAPTSSPVKGNRISIIEEEEDDEMYAALAEGVQGMQVGGQGIQGVMGVMDDSTIAATTTAAAAAATTTTAAATTTTATTAATTTTTTTTTTTPLTSPASAKRKTPQSGSKKGAKTTPEVGKGSKPIPEVGNIRSAYDLERELTLAAGSNAALGRVFKQVSPKQSKALLRDLLEPSLLHLLLSCAYTYYSKKGKWGKVVSWFDEVRNVPAFSLQYSLLAGDLRGQLGVLLGGVEEGVRGMGVAGGAGEGAEEGGTEAQTEEAGNDMLARLEKLKPFY